MKRLEPRAMRWRLGWVVLLLSWVSWDAPGEARMVPHPCLGRWVGWGANAGDAPWSIDMEVRRVSGAPCGTIEYPSLACGGRLERCRVREDGWVEWQEVYTHNPGTCAPAGRVVAQCSPEGSMRWVWYGINRVETRLRREAE